MSAVWPMVGDRERDAAVARIAARHARWDDPRWSEAGAEGDDPARDVLAYVRAGWRRWPRWIAADDAHDELVLVAWVWWDERRREHELLTRALELGRSLGEVGAVLGLRTRQAVDEHLLRLQALLGVHRDDQDRQRRAAAAYAATHPGRTAEEVTGPLGTAVLDPAHDLYERGRGRRASAIGAGARTVRERRRAERARPTHEQWITTHHDRIAAVVTELLDQTARLGIAAAAEDDDGEEYGLADVLAELTEHRHAGAVSTATLGLLGLALGELRTHPDVAARPRQHGIHQAIAAAALLRADHAVLASPPR